MPNDRMLQFFTYDHLPEHLRDASAPFCLLARTVVGTYPENAERTVLLRKLLEAKDAAVRCVLEGEVRRGAVRLEGEVRRG